MDERVLLTDEERREVLRLYRVWLSLAGEGVSAVVRRNVGEHLIRCADEGRLLRDAFGLHPVVRAMQTAIVAREEIGLKNDTLPAMMLSYCEATPEELTRVKAVFGEGVHAMLHGLGRVHRLYAKNPIVESENFRNLVVSFAEDMRVILYMIADRVNLLRQIKNTANVEAKTKAATEAAYLYAPLAHKLGLYKLKSELEDLSLKYLETEAYYMIKSKLNATKKARDEYIARFIAPIEQMLMAAGLRFHIKGRTKSIHSIWQKMKKTKCSFEGVYDLFAIRIILNSTDRREKQDCWQAYSIITDRYQPNPRRLRDWLSVPKSNGYESLHITVLGPEQKWVEVQIRTERMDEIAEHGLAAHWRYKGVKTTEAGIEDWLAGIRSALEAGDDLQLMDQFKSELKEDEVYVFTPKGDLYAFAAGATVLDFAYRIHSKVGNQCVGAMINGKNVSLRHVLRSGDSVEILTSGTQSPKKDWVNIAATSRAKAKIRLALKDEFAHEITIAKEELERKLKNRKIEWDETTFNLLVKKMAYKESSEFYRAIHAGRLDINDVVENYVAIVRRTDAPPSERVINRSAEGFSFDKADELRAEGNSDVLVIDQNLKGIDFRLAKCCNPVYGDEVFGFVTVNGGIKVHRTTCPNATSMRLRFGYRIVRAVWAGKGESTYSVALRVVGHDDIGIVNNITSIISKDEKITLRSINIDTDDGLFSGIITLMIKDTSVLERLIKKLRTVKGVKSVARA